MDIKRCAAYTRKSHEDGLEQEFNSLDAQREAAENYIASQRMNGWQLVPERYDDGGFSGGNMERPALKRLLADVEAGKIDIIVIYKIDRLSRSLIDFMKLAELLEKHKVSFVSVTQDINTSTSAGRMMLNILMTFAQYEREIIGERIRDKIAGAKKRGKYCGGAPVLGYRADSIEKKLFIVPEEAETVRFVFKRYCELASAKQVAAELNKMGKGTKAWTSVKGNKRGGSKWNCGQIYRLLANPLYVGMVQHNGQLHKGEHEAIVSKKLWDEVRGMIGANTRRDGLTKGAVCLQPLAGILRCGHCDCAMTPTFTKKGVRNYTYYFCQKNAKYPEHNCPLKRIPSGAVEKLILEQLAGVFQTPTVLAATFAEARRQEEELRRNLNAEKASAEKELASIQKAVMTGNASPEQLGRIRDLGNKLSEASEALARIKTPISEADIIGALSNVDALWEELFPGEKHNLLRMLVESVKVFQDSVQITLSMEGMKSLASELSATGYFEKTPPCGNEAIQSERKLLRDGKILITVPVSIKQQSGRKDIIVPQANGQPICQTPLVRAVANAHKWAEMLHSGEVKSVLALARKLKLSDAYVTRVLSLNSLAPDIVEAIFAGNAPSGLSLAKLMRGFPEDWQEQRVMLFLHENISSE